MFYGIIMDTIRDGILRSYGPNIWKRILQEINLPMETFDFYARYDDSILIKICDCKYKNIFFHFYCNKKFSFR